MPFRTFILFLIIAVTTGRAQIPPIIIQSLDRPSVGEIRVGMTLREAIQTLNAEYYSHVSSGDYGWFTQIHDNSGNHQVLLSFWSDANQDRIINYDAVISNIGVHAPDFKTSDGVHVGMMLKVAEKKLGKIIRISTSEPAYEQYAAFTNHPKGIAFKVTGGIFKPGQRETTKYDPQAIIQCIELTAY